MLALVLGQGAMALSHHRDQLFAWIFGATVLAAITAVPGEVRLRVEIAYAASSFAVAVTLALVLFVRTARHWRPAGVAGDRVAATLHPGGSR